MYNIFGPIYSLYSSLFGYHVKSLKVVRKIQRVFWACPLHIYLLTTKREKTLRELHKHWCCDNQANLKFLVDLNQIQHLIIVDSFNNHSLPPRRFSDLILNVFTHCQLSVVPPPNDEACIRQHNTLYTQIRHQQ